MMAWVLGAMFIALAPQAHAQSAYAREGGVSIIPGVRFGWQWGSSPNRDTATREATPTTATSGTWWEAHLDGLVTFGGNRVGAGLSLGYAGLSLTGSAVDARVSLRGPSAMAMLLVSPAQDAYVTLLLGAMLGGLTDYYPEPRRGLIAHTATTVAFRGGALITWAAISSQAIELAFGAGVIYTRSAEVQARSEADGTSLRTQFSGVALVLDVTFTFDGSALSLPMSPASAVTGSQPTPTYSPTAPYRPGSP